jgi:hypothetical protein
LWHLDAVRTVNTIHILESGRRYIRRRIVDTSGSGLVMLRGDLVTESRTKHKKDGDFCDTVDLIETMQQSGNGVEWS